METTFKNAAKNLDIRCILFDLDNTLIETRKADTAACAKIADVLKIRYSISMERAKLISFRFLSDFRNCPDNTVMNLDTWRTLLWSKALGEQFQHDAAEIYRKWLSQRYQHLAPSKAITLLLKKLRKKFQIGLITNGPSCAQWEKIDMLNIRDLFDLILVSGDFSCEKPDRKIFFKACQDLNVHPKNCLMIGDKLETDILGGLAAKLGGTIWLPLARPFSLKNDDPVPDYVIEDLMELYSLIDGHSGTSGPVFCLEEDSNSNLSDGS